jgi:dTDP-glucose 4,6-dehydratase
MIGVSILLDAAREQRVGRYVQVSTDEVYGSVESASFSESSPLRPSSPYSATKAAGDLLLSAHVHTYGIEAVICRGSNSFGPRQYFEKLIPLMTLNALHGDPLPVNGDGRQVRNWLHLEDFCRGIHTVLLRGRPGEVNSLASEKLRSELGRAEVRFERGLAEVVDWYRHNGWWWEPIRSGEYRDYYRRQYGRRLCGASTPRAA